VKTQERNKNPNRPKGRGICQKPPVIDWWHAADANVIEWFLNTVGIPEMYLV